jgi:chlorobactene glucosyltransferase
MKEDWKTVGICAYSILLSVGGLGLGSLKLERDTAKAQREIEELVKVNRNETGVRLPFVSVLIPARNEEVEIEACVGSVFTQNYEALEVIVIDDGSIDRTPQLLQNLQERFGERLKVIRNDEPPPVGWVGKNHALWLGYGVVSRESEWLLFVDADTQLLKDGMLGAVLYAILKKLDFLSFVPGIRWRSFWAQALMPQLFKFYLYTATRFGKQPPPGSVEEATASGAFILARHTAYRDSGGHASIREFVTEDAELARQFRRQGYTTTVLAAPAFVSQTTYRNLPDLWEGTTKNLFLVARRSWLQTLFVIGNEWLYGLVPCGLLVNRLLNRRGHKSERLSWILNIGAVGLVFALHYRISTNMHTGKFYGFLYPVAAVLSGLNLLHSAFKITFQKKVQWKGRDITL